MPETSPPPFRSLVAPTFRWEGSSENLDRKPYFAAKAYNVDLVRR